MGDANTIDRCTIFKRGFDSESWSWGGVQLKFTSSALLVLECVCVNYPPAAKGLGLAGYCPPGGRAIEPDPKNSPRCLGMGC
jgi:hypothetical protein